jgi:hypothetical protein
MTLPAPTAAQVLRLVARYEAGASIPALAAAFGTGTRQVRKALEAAGVTLRTRGGGEKKEGEEAP